MSRKNLCADCETGMSAYRLDEKEPMCPNLYWYTQDMCPYYKVMKKDEKSNSLKNIEISL